jgi:hypothetical protein
MYSFLVLGMIPGTNLQITWQIVLDMAGFTLIACALRVLYAYRHRIELIIMPVSHQRFHASQLHQRIQL